MEIWEKVNSCSRCFLLESESPGYYDKYSWWRIRSAQQKLLPFCFKSEERNCEPRE